MTLMSSERSEAVVRPTRRWTDGLTEAERAEALECARRIAAAVRRWPTESLDAGSLASGLAGMAIFEAYLALAGEPDADKKCLERLAQVASALEESPSIPTLFAGSVGAAFTLEHVRRRMLDDGPEMV